MPVLAAITDSIKLTTGFAQVAKQILLGFHNAGFDVYSFGTMDWEHDLYHELPFSFTPVNPNDIMGHRTVQFFLTGLREIDVIFLLYDPGNVNTFVRIIHTLQESGQINKCPIIVYTPIEGFPIPATTAKTFDMIQEKGGEVVLYSPGMIELFNTQYELNKPLHWAHHGSDHANFRSYEPDYRKHLRNISGLDQYFVIGSFGVNKRTKGFDTIIYTARCLKDLKRHKDIKFYLHTSPDNPTMYGYDLKDMAAIYDVSDMILFKPEVEKEAGGNIKGIRRNSPDFSYLQRPEKVSDRKDLFTAFGFIDRLNCMDLYLDLSQVEGWGLPAFEAMKCGVPTVSVHDYAIRDEIYSHYVDMIEPEPIRKWSTWHTGAKLVTVDPQVVAERLLFLMDAHNIREQLSFMGEKRASEFKWKDTQEKFVKIVNEVL